MVLSVSVQENNTVVDEFIAKYSLEYPFLLDIDGSVSRSYNIYTTPTTYFINPDGVITDILPGLVTEQWIAAIWLQLRGSHLQTENIDNSSKKFKRKGNQYYDKTKYWFPLHSLIIYAPVPNFRSEY